MSWTVLVVDDEPLARRALVRYLQGEPDMRVVGECGDGLAAAQAIRALAPDVVFLDIEMPEASGLDVPSLVGAGRMPAIVFVTAYEQYAVRAFEAGAVDYLVKPFGAKRLADSLARLRARLASGEAGGGAAAARILEAVATLRRRDAYVDRIPVRVDGSVEFVEVADVAWIEASRNTVRLHLDGRSHELRVPMAALASRLDPRRFARIHRSTIVNLLRVRAVRPWTGGHHLVLLDTGHELRMSRYQHEAFVQLVSLGAPR